MSQFEINTHITFVVWIVFMKAILLCLNLEPDDGFLSYSKPEVFDKTEHNLTDNVIVSDEFKPVLHPEFFLGIWYIYVPCSRVER